MNCRCAIHRSLDINLGASEPPAAPITTQTPVLLNLMPLGRCRRPLGSLLLRRTPASVLPCDRVSFSSSLPSATCSPGRRRAADPRGHRPHSLCSWMLLLVSHRLILCLVPSQGAGPSGGILLRLDIGTYIFYYLFNGSFWPTERRGFLGGGGVSGTASPASKVHARVQGERGYQRLYHKKSS